MAINRLVEKIGGIIVPKDDCWSVKSLRDIKENYPDKYKDIIAFLHYMKSMSPEDSIYADVPDDEREEQILRDLQLDIDIQSPLIKAGLDTFEEKYYTTFYGLYRGIKMQLDGIGKKLMTTQINFEKDGNSNQIARFMEKYEFLRKSFKTAYRDFEEERGQSRNRGGADTSYDEDDD